MWECGGSCSPLELGRGSKAGKSLGFIPALLSPDITNLRESLYIVPLTCPYVKGGTWLQELFKTRGVGNMVSYVNRPPCYGILLLTTGNVSCGLHRQMHFCPLTGSMRGETTGSLPQHWPQTRIMLFLILQWGCHRQQGWGGVGWGVPIKELR